MSELGSEVVVLMAGSRESYNIRMRWWFIHEKVGAFGEVKQVCSFWEDTLSCTRVEAGR